MKALVYHGPGRKEWQDVPDAHVVDTTDVVVQVDTTTICGTDLHILLGDVPAVTPGRILGHEAVGTVVEVGSAVGKFVVGDRVVVPAITSCGTCRYCRVGRASHCQSVGGIGWVLGHLVDGTQAELVRVPFGDTSLHRVPAGLSDEEVIFLSDIFPTGYEMGVRNGAVSPGDSVVCIGAGPVGLAAMATAHLHGARRVIAVDLDPFRLDRAVRDFGATHAVRADADGWQDEVRDLCGGRGADVVMEAVGVPQTLEAAFDLVVPYGHVAAPGHAPDRPAVDREHHDHDGPGRRGDGADAARPRGRGLARHPVDGDAHLRARPDARGVRGVRQGGAERRAQGRAAPVTRTGGRRRR